MKKNNKNKKNNISYSQSGFSILGNSIKSCGELIINKNTFYEIQTFNTEAQAYKNKIVNWIGKNGIYLEQEDGKIFNDKKILDKVLGVFSDKTFKMFKEKYFINNFCSGDLYFYPKMNLLGDITCQIIDSRTIYKEIDSLGNIIKYKQIIGGVSKDIPEEKIYNSIVRYNVNNPNYGSSIYESIVYDALAEKETARKNYYFFKNNAVPNVIFMLDKEMNADSIKLTEESIKQKYQGTSNSNNFMLSNAITDAKILDMNYKDLDLIKLREFVIQKMGIVFQIDPRIIGFIQDVGTYNSIKEIKKEANETIQSLAKQLEDDMNNFYKIFIDKTFKYKIKLDSESFEDRENIEENQRKDVELGLQTIEMVWNERGYDISKLPDQAKKPLIKSNLELLESKNTIINT